MRSQSVAQIFFQMIMEWFKSGYIMSRSTLYVVAFTQREILKVPINLFFERKDSTGYAIYSRGTLYQLVPTEDTVDRIKKVTLSDRDSIVHLYHLDDGYLFEPGEYRVKCTYRNNIHKRDMVESEWAYFKVLNKIFVKHYYEQD